LNVKEDPELKTVLENEIFVFSHELVDVGDSPDTIPGETTTDNSGKSRDEMVSSLPLELKTDIRNVQKKVSYFYSLLNHKFLDDNYEDAAPNTGKRKSTEKEVDLGYGGWNGNIESLTRILEAMVQTPLVYWGLCSQFIPNWKELGTEDTDSLWIKLTGHWGIIPRPPPLPNVFSMLGFEKPDQPEPKAKGRRETYLTDIVELQSAIKDALSEKDNPYGYPLKKLTVEQTLEKIIGRYDGCNFTTEYNVPSNPFTGHLGYKIKLAYLKHVLESISRFKRTTQSIDLIGSDTTRETEERADRKAGKKKAEKETKKSTKLLRKALKYGQWYGKSEGKKKKATEWALKLSKEKKLEQLKLLQTGADPKKETIDNNEKLTELLLKSAVIYATEVAEENEEEEEEESEDETDEIEMLPYGDTATDEDDVCEQAQFLSENFKRAEVLVKIFEHLHTWLKTFPRWETIGTEGKSLSAADTMILERYTILAYHVAEGTARVGIIKFLNTYTNFILYAICNSHNVVEQGLESLSRVPPGGDHVQLLEDKIVEYRALDGSKSERPLGDSLYEFGLQLTDWLNETNPNSFAGMLQTRKGSAKKLEYVNPLLIKFSSVIHIDPFKNLGTKGGITPALMSRGATKYLEYIPTKKGTSPESWAEMMPDLYKESQKALPAPHGEGASSGGIGAKMNKTLEDL